MTSWLRNPTAVVLVAGAAYRITRLLTTDPLPPARAARSAAEDWVADRWPEYAHGVTCTWCIGFWASALVVGAVELADRRGHLNTALLAAAPWAISAAVGTAADREIH